MLLTLLVVALGWCLVSVVAAPLVAAFIARSGWCPELTPLHGVRASVDHGPATGFQTQDRETEQVS